MYSIEFYDHLAPDDSDPFAFICSDARPMVGDDVYILIERGNLVKGCVTKVEVWYDCENFNTHGHKYGETRNLAVWVKKYA